MTRLIFAIAKAFVMLLLVVIFIIGLRFVEILIETAADNCLLWDITCVVLCFCWLVYTCYKGRA